MSQPEGYYYLHENKDLVYKPYDDGRYGDFMDSDFVKLFWPMDMTSRACAWQFLVEAACAGAKPERITELAKKWGCDNKDAEQYAKHLRLTLTEENGKFTARSTATSFGVGDNALEAFISLCKQLKFQPTKIGWHHKFSELVNEDQKIGIQ